MSVDQQKALAIAYSGEFDNAWIEALIASMTCHR
jgi:hypothetical protein